MREGRWIALLAVAIPIGALFGPVLVSDRSFALRDAAHFYYPLFEWCCEEWGAGRVPLWNPLENAGIPALADTSSSVFYPGKLLFFLPLPFVLRYKLYVVLHVVLAAAGSYWLARSWRSSRYAASLAAMAYACGGAVVFQYANVVFLVGAAWLPLAALAAERMVARRSGSAAVGLGVVLALMVLGGDPQAAYHALLGTGMYVLLVAVHPGVRDGSADAMPSRGRDLTIRAGLTGLAAGIGFALAAVQVLPSSEATRYSERAAFDEPRSVFELVQMSELDPPARQAPVVAIAKGIFGIPEPGTHQALAYDFSIGPWRLAECVWPNVSGRMFPSNRRWLSLMPWEGRAWTPTLYLGLAPLLLGLSCFSLRSRDARVRWCSWLVLLFTLGSFGWYGLGWIAGELYGQMTGGKLGVGPHVGGVYWLMATLLPTYIYFRYPAKLLPLAALGVSQLAAFGWDQALAEPRPRLAWLLKWLGIGSAAAAFAVWCVGSSAWLRIERGDAALGPFDWAGAYRDVLCAFLHTALVAGGLAWLLRKAWTDAASTGRWRAALLLLTAAELAVANAWLVATAPAAIWRGEPAVAKAIEPSPADPSAPPMRVFRGNLAGWRPASFRRHISTDRPAEMARWERQTLFPKHHLAADVALVESYGSIKLLDYESLLFVARQHGFVQPDKSVIPQPAALRLMGTQSLVLPPSHAPEFAERIEPPDQSLPESTALWRMKRTLPRAWIVHQVETLPPLPFPLRTAAVDARAKEILFPGLRARDFRVIAVVESATPVAPLPEVPPSRAPEECRITRYEPQRVVIQTELAAPGLVVLSDQWYPGWTATVATADQPPRTMPILRTNRVARGVALPAGRHVIEYRFQPTSFNRGAWISAIAWLCLVALVAGSNWRRRTA